MASSQPIVFWYLEQEFDHVAINFDDHLVDAVETSLGKSRIEAEFYAENHSERLWNRLRNQIEEDKNRGLYPTFSEVKSGFKRLFWNPKYFPRGASKNDRQRRQRLRSRIKILKTIESIDDPTHFEALSVYACKLSAASDYCLTPRNDFGIDFFAVIPSIGRSHVFSGGAGPLRIIGQCKKHASTVSRGSLQQFFSSIVSVQERSDDVRNLIPNWFLTERGPIVGWYITHLGLQNGAREFAEKHGIIHSDSRDIGEIITMSRSWTPSDGLNAPVRMMWQQIENLLCAKRCRDP